MSITKIMVVSYFWKLINYKMFCDVFLKVYNLISLSGINFEPTVGKCYGSTNKAIIDSRNVLYI